MPNQTHWILHLPLNMIVPEIVLSVNIVHYITSLIVAVFGRFIVSGLTAGSVKG